MSIATRSLSQRKDTEQAARISDRTAFFNLAATGQPGELVEIDDTEKIFTRPSDPRTNDYVSGRFG